ncbi:MAG: hypothetical protein ACN6OV_11735 [Acinetobacter sp.]|uniref:hypothetical protein n=1 Tax=Acinetobacter sp. TaxID=472 RepID=UPI003D0131E1
MKVILLLGVLFLVACSKQDNVHQAIEQQPNQDTNVENTLAFVQEQKKRAASYSQTDPAVRLDMLNMVAVVRTLYPDFPAHFVEEENMFQTTGSKDGKVTSFNRFTDWISVKVFHNKSNQNINHLTVEVYDHRSYQQSKQETLEVCKNIWNNIDHRVPKVIDELSDRLKKYESHNSSAVTSHIHHGYVYNLDASHYSDGYPIVCTVGYDGN